MNKEYLKILIDHKWLFEKASDSKEISEVQDYANGRLVEADNSLFDFLNSINLLANPEDTIWYIPLSDYSNKEKAKDEFAWNDFEIESLEYADDESEKKEIIAFWTNNLPFFFSVKNGYSYIAMVLSGENKGKIVYGREPMYEDIEIISESFEEFIKLHGNALSGEQTNKNISDFI